MTRPLRVYRLPNLDGTHEAIVAALNQKEAGGEPGELVPEVSEEEVR